MSLLQPAPRRRLGKTPIPVVVPKWTAGEIDDIVRLHVEDGVSVTRLAKLKGTTYAHVRNTLIERGALKRRGLPVLSAESTREMLELYRDGWGILPLSKRFQCSYDTIRLSLVANGLALRRYHKRVFTPEEVEEIVSRYLGGESVLSLTKQLHCSSQPIIRFLKERGIPHRGRYGKTHRWTQRRPNRLMPIATFHNRRNTALRNGTEWRITTDDIEALYRSQNGRCAYTNLEMATASYAPEYNALVKSNPLAVSIDRRDSNKGYTPENIVLCCRFVNYAKNAYPEERFRQVLQQTVDALRPDEPIPRFNPWSFGC
jgi:hypothetical protein